MRVFVYSVLVVMFGLSSAWSGTLQQALTNTYNCNPEFKEKQEEIKAEHEKIVNVWTRPFLLRLLL